MSSPTTHNPAQPGSGPISDTPATGSSDAKLLERIRERYTYMVKSHKLNRDLGESDMQALYGEHGAWDPLEVAARKKANRPCVNLPQLPQYPNALVNQVRQNPQGVKVNPAGNGATDQTAELQGNRIRAIEAECNAKQAYLTALQCSAERGYGVVTMECEDIDWDGFDQRVKICREPDPNAVIWDPDYKEADASDIRDGFKLWWIPRPVYQRRWPNASVQSWRSEDAAIAPEWCDEQNVLVARYSYIEETERYVYLLDDGSPKGKKVFRDELAKGFKSEKGWLRFEGSGGYRILHEKKAIEKKVKQCITNGVEILDKADWAGRQVPIFPMVGKEVWMQQAGDARPVRLTLSYIRQAIDAQRTFNSAKTNEVEAANMVPKIVYMMYEGQEDTATDWENINRINTAFALVKPITDGATGTVLPLPRREAYEPPIQGMEIMAEAARRAIQAAIGSHGFTIQDDTNVKSGKAVNALKQQSDVGSYHFIDGYETTIRAIGRELSVLLPVIEDSPRDVAIQKNDGKREMLRINEPYQDKKGETIEHRYTPRDPKTNEPLTDSRNDVVIDSGKSYETQQLEASDFVEALLAHPAMGPRVADLAVKWKNLGTFGDQMAERLQPPDTLQQEGMEDLPPQAKQQIGQLTAQNQELTQVVQQLLQEREAKTAELVSKEKIAAEDSRVKQLQIESNERIARMNLQSKGAIVAEQLNSAENSRQTEMEFERQNAELAHAQNLDEAAAGADQKANLSAQDHVQSLDAGAQGHQQTLEQQSQQAEAAQAQQTQAEQAAADQAALAAENQPPTE